MKKNLTKIMMMALCLCMMVAMFAFVASAEEAPVSIKNATVTLDSYYSFFDGKEKDLPGVNLFVDGKEVDPEAYTVEWKYDNAKVVTKAREEGQYIPVIKAVEGKGYTGKRVAAAGDTSIRYHVINDDAKNDKAVEITVDPEFNYGDSVEDKIAIKYIWDDYKTTIVEYYAVAEDGAMTKLDEAPVDAGDYAIRVVELYRNFFSDVTEKFTIDKKVVNIVVNPAQKVYGEADPDFTCVVDGLVYNETNADLDIEWYRDRVGEEHVDLYRITILGIGNENYELGDVASADLEIVPRVLTAADFENNLVVTYNGKLQLPEYKIVNPSFADDVYELEILGARKYGGTYTARIVSIDNDNYVLEGDIKLQYTIVAEDGKDGDVAVDKIETGLGNAGSAMESIAPTLGNIGGSIVDGIVAVFKAIFADFFSRVFGA
jgi:hypothetical protein